MTLHAPPSSHPSRPLLINRGERNMNPPDIGFLALLREDFRTHDRKWLEQGFWAVATHRFGNWRMGLPKLLRMPATLLYRFLHRWVQWTCGITLPYTVILGRRVRIWHHGGMVLNAARIGDDVHIRQNTTFGIPKRDMEYHIPIIEDRVDIGVGVVIIGNVMVGHDSQIGANAVVITDIPPNSIAVGIPAKVCKTL